MAGEKYAEVSFRYWGMLISTADGIDSTLRTVARLKEVLSWCMKATGD